MDGPNCLWISFLPTTLFAAFSHVHAGMQLATYLPIAKAMPPPPMLTLWQQAVRFAKMYNTTNKALATLNLGHDDQCALVELAATNTATHVYGVNTKQEMEHKVKATLQQHDNHQKMSMPGMETLHLLVMCNYIVFVATQFYLLELDAIAPGSLNANNTSICLWGKESSQHTKAIEQIINDIFKPRVPNTRKITDSIGHGVETTATSYELAHKAIISTLLLCSEFVACLFVNMVDKLKCTK